MGMKKAERYRGFNIFTERVRTGVWAVSVVEIPPSEGLAVVRAPSHGRLPGEHPSKEAAVAAGRAQVERIHKNRLNRANQAVS